MENARKKRHLEEGVVEIVKSRTLVRNGGGAEMVQR